VTGIIFFHGLAVKFKCTNFQSAGISSWYHCSDLWVIQFLHHVVFPFRSISASHHAALILSELDINGLDW